MLIDDGLLTARTATGCQPATCRRSPFRRRSTPCSRRGSTACGRDERAVIERGSVEGKVFHRGAVAELSTEQLRESVWSHLQALVRKELIRPDRTDSARRGRVPVPAPADSRRGVRSDAEGASRRAARAICGLARPDRPDRREQDEIVGYHLEQAYRYRAELAPVDVGRRGARASRRGTAGERRPPAMRRQMCPRRSGSASVRSPSSPRRTSCDPALLADSDTRWSSVATSTRLETAYDDGLVAANLAGDRAAGALIEARKAALQTMRGGLMDDAVTSPASARRGAGGTRRRRGVWPKCSTSWASTSAGRTATRLTTSSGPPGSRTTLGNLRLEAAAIGWLCVDAFWYDGSVARRFEALRSAPRPSERPRRRRAGCALIRGNFKRMAGREEEGRADVEEGTARQMELGRTVDAHAYSMMTACVSLLAGRYEEAETEIMPAHDALKAYGETGYLSTVSGIAAFALAAQGRSDEAEVYVDEARAIGADGRRYDSGLLAGGKGESPRRARGPRRGVRPGGGEPRSP